MKKLFILFTISLLNLGAVQAQIPTNGLAAYYPFNGNANDMSGTGNSGTVNGATLTNDRFFNTNAAYNFNSYTYITVPRSQSLNTETWTISAWYKTTSPDKQRVTSKAENSSTTNYMCIMMDNNGHIYGTTWLGSNATQIITMDPVTTNDGKWHNVTYIRDVAQKKYFLYVDNVLKATQNDYYELMGNNQALSIGRNYVDNEYWSGSIDDIRIYTRVLTPNEIAAIYNEGVCYQTITVTDTLRIKSGITTGINSLPTTFGEVKIYPNPANSVLNVSISKPSSSYTIKFYDPQGNEVYVNTMNTSSLQVDLTNFTVKGLYFIKILDNASQILETKKLILE